MDIEEIVEQIEPNRALIISRDYNGLLSFKFLPESYVDISDIMFCREKELSRKLINNYPDKAKLFKSAIIKVIHGRDS